MAIRLIATDMDDTLLGPDGALSSRTKAAAAEAMRRGVRFVLSSGRMPQAMRKTAQELNVNSPVIAYNGGMIADAITGEVLKSWPVEQAEAREAAKLAESLGGHVQAYKNGTYYYQEENDFARAYARSIGLQGQAAGEPLSQWFTGAADKLLVIGNPHDVSRWVEKMQAHFGTRLCCAVSRPNYIEVFAHGTDKSAALEELCMRLGVRREETAAFGDGENDLGMVRWAEKGFVMANARPQVLEKAPAVAPSNAQDGLAQVLEKWFEDGTIPQR